MTNADVSIALENWKNEGTTGLRWYTVESVQLVTVKLVSNSQDVEFTAKTLAEAAEGALNEWSPF